MSFEESLEKIITKVVTEELNSFRAEMAEVLMNNEKSFNEKEYYTISETARKIGQSEHTVKRLCKEGRLKRNDSINPNQPVINRDSLFVFLKEENKRFY